MTSELYLNIYGMNHKVVTNEWKRNLNELAWKKAIDLADTEEDVLKAKKLEINLIKTSLATSVANIRSL